MTLDEVIDSIETCISFGGECSECSKGGICLCFPSREFDTEILRYLNEYKNMKALYKDGIKICSQTINRYEKIIAEYLKDMMQNPPLTWDELKQMEGKPVWVEYTKTNESYWVFVGDWYDDDEMRVYRMEQDYCDYIIRDLYSSEGWQAYRKER